MNVEKNASDLDLLSGSTFQEKCIKNDLFWRYEFFEAHNFLAKKFTFFKKVRNKNELLSLRFELKTSRLLNGCSNQLSYESQVIC